MINYFKILFFGFWFVSAFSVSASITKTVEEAKSLYHEIVIEEPIEGDEKRLYIQFSDGVYKIHITFWDGSAHDVKYTRRDLKALTDSEIKKILKINAGELIWKENRFADSHLNYERSDKKVKAKKVLNGLRIITEKYSNTFYPSK